MRLERDLCMLKESKAANNEANKLFSMLGIVLEASGAFLSKSLPR